MDPNFIPQDSIYNPPYESPLEDIFAYNAAKYLSASVSFKKQVEFKTICGTFRTDFVASTSIDSIAIECDGNKYHNKSRDEWRDAMILGEKELSTIFRLRGNDLIYRIEDCFFLLSRFLPSFFTARGLVNLKTLASNNAKRYNIKPDDNIILIPYPDRSNFINPIFLFIERHTFQTSSGKNTFLKKIYEFAKNLGGGDLDTMITEYRRKWEVY